MLLQTLRKLGSLDSRFPHSMETCRVQCHGQTAQPRVVACKVVAADNRIVLQPGNQGGSFIEDLRSKRRKRTFERNGVYVLPWLVVKQNSQKRLTLWSSRAQTTRPAGLPVSPVTSAETNMDVSVEESGPSGITRCFSFAENFYLVIAKLT